MQLPSSWEKNPFYSWWYNGIETRAIHIWCIPICSFNCSFWGDFIYNSCFINPCSFFSLHFKIAITEVQVPREEEFAPVKNANGSNFDTPESARLLVLRLHTRWVVAAGGFVTHSVPLYATGNFMLYFACLIIVTSWKTSECL